MITFLITQSFYFIVPLLVVALAGMFSEKSGTVNIALEGLMVIGAFAGIFFVNRMQAAGAFANSPQLLLIIALIISAAAGMLFSALLGFLAINMKANQTIGGVALNILAGALVIFLSRTLTVEGTSHIRFEKVFKLNANVIPDAAEGSFLESINKIFFFDAYLTTYIAFAILIFSVIIIYYTRFGMRLSACGEHPEAAQSVGINVYKYRWAGVLISGALAGMGGLMYIIPTTVSFDGGVAGYGFLALAVLIFGQWKPGRILLAAIFFGVFQTLSVTFIGIDFIRTWIEKNPNVPIGMFFRLMPYIVTMIALAISSKSSRAPKAAGVPFDAQGK